MRTNVILALGAFLMLSGCCTPNGAGHPVVVETSLSRLELPERPARRFRFALGGAPNAFVVLTPGQIAAAPAASNAEVVNTQPDSNNCDDSGNDLRGSAEVCLAKRVVIGFARYSGGPPMVKLRLHLAGGDRQRAKVGSASLALTGAWGSDKRTIQDAGPDGHYATRTDRSQLDLGLIAGVRLARTLVLYGGPYLIRSNYAFNHERPNTAPISDSGDVVARGGHLGVGFYASPSSTWLLEYSRAGVEAGDNDDDLERVSLMFQLDLGRF
jgi:hypothetical protein